MEFLALQIVALFYLHHFFWNQLVFSFSSLSNTTGSRVDRVIEGLVVCFPVELESNAEWQHVLFGDWLSLLWERLPLLQ